MDNNYPPYVFQDEKGQLKGILIDQWKLWEQHTGVPVEITARPWGEALARMRAGEFDVVDTIFYTDERGQVLDFTPPYAQIDVLIFFNKSISGISQAEDLKGFRVAVKSGDANAEYLQARGVYNLTYYDGYEAIVRAAAEQQETIFVIDQPPGMYFLYKYGVQEQFNHSAPLYGGAFHRAVKKGDAETLTLVENGFKEITACEYQVIDERWFGTSQSTWNIKLLLPYLGLGGLFGGLLIFVLVAFNRALRVQVRTRTQELDEALAGLRENRKFLADIIEYSGALMFVKDREGHYELVNRKWEEVTGLQRQGVLGSTDVELFDPPTAEQFRTHDLQVIDTGQVIEFEEMLRQQANLRYFISIKFPVWAEDGRVKRVCGMITEITDRKQTEQALRESEAQVRGLNATLERRVAERTAQLELANKELEAFTYSVSHDLRAPLRAINGYTRIVLEDYGTQLSGEVPDLLGQVCAASQHMGDLIDALLSLSRQTRVEMQWEQVDLSALAQASAAKLRQAQPERPSEFIIAPGLIVQGDAYLLGVALENLLDNAWKYTRPVALTRIELGIQTQDGQEVYFVRDNGIGFNMAHAGKIFEAFQRLHLSEEFEGEGIGLATVQRIIHRHGGRIWAEAEVDRGATFYFTLTATHKE